MELEMSTIEVPVVLFIFKRKDTVLRIIKKLRKVAPKKIYVIADGPRKDVPGESAACENARTAVGEIDWECTVHRKFREENMGGPVSIMNGLDWVFSEEPFCIMLEDDDLADPSFIRFCSELLIKYRDENEIVLVLGSNRGIRRTKESYHFDYHPPALLGLGMWRRFWLNFNKELSDWPHLKENGEIAARFSSKNRYRQLSAMWDALYSGEYESWDFTLLYNFYAQKGICIVPETNMVENIGFGADATRTKEQNPFIHVPKGDAVAFPLEHPVSLDLLNGTDRLIYRRKYGLKAKAGKAWYKLKHMAKTIG
jgi:hypothetical protein